MPKYKNPFDCGCGPGADCPHNAEVCALLADLDGAIFADLLPDVRIIQRQFDDLAPPADTRPHVDVAPSEPDNGASGASGGQSPRQSGAIACASENRENGDGPAKSRDSGGSDAPDTGGRRHRGRPGPGT